ncbi:MAG: xanthine dehydrogenase family protein molybdopterin-binding subunit, partial [Actinomycetota bacterium]|nr:xanthine dehydrogenase family protein molybdopterin-binding subunit [Actinomycetota bacterium]
REDPGFLTYGAQYTADLNDTRLEGAVWATFVRSTMAHAHITVDVSAVVGMPGVVGVYTASDLDGPTVLPGVVPLFPEPMLNRPILAIDTVRFVGECVAVVLTEDPYQGVDAADAVEVDYEPLPAVVDMEEAVTDVTLIYEELGTNQAINFADLGMATGTTDEGFFGECEVLLEGRVVHQRTAAAPLEPRSTAATWVGDKLVVWISNQGPHSVRGNLESLYGDQATGGIQVIVPDVGGGFGAKLAPYPEDVILPWLSAEAGRPVRWFETRTENMLAMGPGRAHVHYFRIGGTRGGDVTHYQLDVLVDSGAYTRIGAFLPMFTLPMTTGPYDIPHAENGARTVVTNTTPTEAYRGAGRPEATLTLERAMDMFAAEIGLDPTEIRRRNYLQAEDFPVATSVGTEYDSGDYEKSLDLALRAIDYEGLRVEQLRRRETGERMQLGIGIATYVEITAGPAPGGSEYARVEIAPEGRATIYTGTLSHGQGHLTTFSMIAADQLGIDIDEIDFVQGDTDLVAEGTGTFGSRSTQLAGSSVHTAAGQVVDDARRVAADLLEANVEDVVLDRSTGTFHVVGSPSVSRTWTEVAATGEELAAESNETMPCTYPFGTHVAVVEIDTDTGAVRLDRIVTCDDAGTIINPVIVEGQRHGGIAQGVAQALLEEVVYDADGTPQTTNFADYSIISMAELPSFELVPLETATPNNPLGVKGIGESGAVGSTPAVANAVIDGLSHLGIHHLDVPLSPQRVWEAIRSSAQ